MSAIYRPGRFSIEGSEIFSGYTSGKIWNGWACPTFTKDQAIKVLTLFVPNHITGPDAKPKEKDEEYWYFNEKSDTFYYYNSNWEIIEKFKGRDVSTADGTIHVYDVGSGWVFSEEDPNLPEKLVMVTFYPIPDDENPYPFKDHMESPGYVEITREIVPMSQISYESSIQNINDYANRRRARAELIVLVENFTGRVCIKNADGSTVFYEPARPVKSIVYDFQNINRG